MPSNTSGAPATGMPSSCFVRPWVDPWLAGGISLVFFAVVLAVGPKQVPTAVYAVAGFLQWIINWPHFSATNFRLLGRAENRREFPLTTYVIPWVVLSAVVASFVYPMDVAPHFVKFFMMWSPYHFSAQSLGIVLLYARRAGYPIGPWERRALSAFIYGAFLVSTARAESGFTGADYYGMHYSGLGIPDWVATALSVVMYAGLVGFLISVVRRYSKEGKLPPYVLAVVGASQFVWFVVGYHAPLFYLFVPAFHSLQYLLIAWVMEMGEKPVQMKAPAATVRWYAVNVAGGAFLFWGIPQIVHYFGTPLNLATAVVIAGVQIHHFFVDGVIWKLKNPRVANPLTISWPAPGQAKAAA